MPLYEIVSFDKAALDLPKIFSFGRYYRTIRWRVNVERRLNSVL